LARCLRVRLDMNWLALVAAIVCALIALVYAVPSLALAALIRFVGRRTGIRVPLGLLSFIRLPWGPVLLWGSAALIFGWIAISG
jgi:hypothetical protein